MQDTTGSRNDSLGFTCLAVAVALMWFSGTATPVIADMPIYATQALDRWAAALGGRERLARVETIHSTGTVSMAGLDGTVEEWLTAAGCHRHDLDLAGVFSVTLIRTPQACWMRDQNGKVSERGGKEAQDEARDVFLGTWSHLLPDRMAGTVRALGIDSTTGGSRLQIVPEDGTELTVWLDPGTGLPVRWESPDESGDTLTSTYGDWRSIDGVLLPMRISQTTGTAASDVVTELGEVRFNETPPPDAFERPQEKADDVRFDYGQDAGAIPVDIDGVHLLLQIRVNDSTPQWFALDSGAGMTCIDTEAARDMGLTLSGQVEADGVGEGKIATHLVQNVSFQLPGVEVSNQTVLAAPLRSILESRFGREIDGILGYDFISRFVVEIDYWNKVLHLHDRHGWEYEGAGAVIPIRISGNVPACDATIRMPDGRSFTCNLELDTGSGDTISLSRPFTEEHDLLSALTRRAESCGGFGIGGVSCDVIGRIAAVTLGGLEFAEPVCEFSLDSRGVGADVSIQGKLGGGIFERGTLILDYERQRMFFEPNPRFETPFLGEMCGLTIVTGGHGDWHTFTVANVIAGSPADSAGVQVGDVILSAGGTPASELWLRGLEEMFREQGRTIRLKLLRDGATRVVEVTMRPVV